MTVGQLVVLRTRAGVRAGRRMVGTRSYSAADLAIGAYLVIIGVFVAFRLLEHRALGFTRLRSPCLLVDPRWAGLRDHPPG